MVQESKVQKAEVFVQKSQNSFSSTQQKPLVLFGHWARRQKDVCDLRAHKNFSAFLVIGKNNPVIWVTVNNEAQNTGRGSWIQGVRNSAQRPPGSKMVQLVTVWKKRFALLEFQSVLL